MILVSRERFQPSETWRKRANKELAKATEFFANKPGGRFDFSMYRHSEIRNLLLELFNEKCCYCESRLNISSQFDFEHFRPKSAVMGLDGETRRPGYWWLASDWANLYAACPLCNRNKANRFPLVDESARALLPESDLSAERPLLLDPCATGEWEDPDLYLVFSEDGLVASSFGTEWSNASSDPAGREQESFDEFRQRRFDDHDPAQVTIDAVGLNRAGLVAARGEAALATRQRAEKQPLPNNLQDLDQFDEWYAQFIEHNGEYVQLQRQTLRQIAWEEWKAARPSAKRDATGAREDPTVEQFTREDFTGKSAEVFSRIRKDEDVERVVVEQRAYQQDLAGISVEDESDAHFGRSSHIERVRIVNFRCFDDLDFNLGSSTADRAGWKMMLGENGTGKSTVLHAAALVLMGQKNFHRLVELGDLDPGSLRRREAGEQEEAFVEVWLGADSVPRRMTLNFDGSVDFSASAQKGSRMALLGFGSARWLYREGGFEPDRDPYIRVRNLFNPFVPLGDTVNWLLNLDDAEFKAAQEPLLELLGLTAGEWLERHSERGAVMVGNPATSPEHWDRLTDLSDGYQTVLAMTGDIIELLSRQFPNIVTAEGVVMIDEIGAHLHPRWKMRVVSRLRDTFPQMQVLATTHEPLCLRGLSDGEIMVVRQREDAGGIEALDNLPAVDDLRIDQLLTSELFGLYTTLDPETEDKMNRYYELLARESLSDNERTELEVLKVDVGSKGVLGDTPRDRLIYEAVDEYIANKRSTEGVEEITELKEETKRQVAALWSGIAEMDS